MHLNYLESLPIFSHKDTIIRAIEENVVSIVVGETGSGKSTQIPKMIIEALANRGKADPSASNLKIACTQPRRIAAVSIATWIAQEMEVTLGEEVGYKIRFDDDTTKGTVVTICTDGILLQEMKGDPLLSKYDAILVDEAHERNLNIDFLLGLLKDIQNKRKAVNKNELKIVVTSATFDAQKFADFFADLNIDQKGILKEIPIINVSGRLFPVDISYNPIVDEEDIYRKIAKIVQEIEEDERKLGLKKGGILIFMPGEGEIFKTIDEIEKLRNINLISFPLYSRLSMEDQEKIYQHFEDKNKIVVATNIAETSLTVPDIRYVIDTGLARITDFNFRTGIGSLEVTKISKASIIQRAGRAGRVEPGICIRLFSEEDFESRDDYTKPEIQRSDLSSVVLHMLLIGIENLFNFNFIDSPEPKAFKNAINNLIELGALDQNQKLTVLGERMAILPLEPRISVMLLMAEKYGCVNKIAIIASSLSVKDPFLRPKDEEDLADKAKKYFQRLAGGNVTKYKTIKLRRGRKLITKRVVDKSSNNQQLMSDLIVFLVVWNKLQSLKTEEEKISYCQINYLNWLMFKEIEQIYRQLLDTLNIFAKEEFQKYQLIEGQTDLSVKLENREGVLKSIASGFIQNLCELIGHQIYKTRNTENIFIHPGSALFYINPKVFVSAEIIETTRLYARNNTMIDLAWLEEIAPQLSKKKEGPIRFDYKSGRTFREEEVYFRDKKIVKKRMIDLSETNPKLAEEFLVKEGLVRGQFVRFFPWLEKNYKLLAQLKLYASQLNNPDLIFNNQKLKEWYLKKFEKSLKPITSINGIRELLKDFGEDYLVMTIDKILSKSDLEKINKIFPGEIFLSGKKYLIKYMFDEGRYVDGPNIFVNVGDLQDLNNEIIKNNLRDYPNLRPNFVIISEGNKEEITSGEDIDELKNRVDHWHLKKYWQKLRKNVEVKNIRIEDVWRNWKGLLSQFEVGHSLFESGELGIIYAYIGFCKNGHKINKVLFEDIEVAWRTSLEVIKELFKLQVKGALNFKEIKILELEKKYQDYIYGFDINSILKKILWKRLDFENKLADYAVIKDELKVKKILEAEQKKLQEYKEECLANLERLLKEIEKLSQSNSREDLLKIAEFKKKIDFAEF